MGMTATIVSFELCREALQPMKIDGLLSSALRIFWYFIQNDHTYAQRMPEMSEALAHLSDSLDERAFLELDENTLVTKNYNDSARI